MFSLNRSNSFSLFLSFWNRSSLEQVGMIRSFFYHSFYFSNRSSLEMAQMIGNFLSLWLASAGVVHLVRRQKTFLEKNGKQIAIFSLIYLKHYNSNFFTMKLYPYHSFCLSVISVNALFCFCSEFLSSVYLRVLHIFQRFFSLKTFQEY